MSKKQQIIKGFLDAFVLQTIKEEPLFSLDIIKRMKDKGYDSLTEGTIYPLLLRLEGNGLISSIREFNSSGPSRKIYSITNKGIRELEELILMWEELKVVCDNILGGNSDG